MARHSRPCTDCGERGLTLDLDNLCHQCWQARRDHEEAEREMEDRICEGCLGELSRRAPENRC